MRKHVTFAATLLTISFLTNALSPFTRTRAQTLPQQTQPQPSPAQTQATPTQTPQDDSDDGDVVRITTNLVQFDAVVTDKKGQQVTDLRPEDFEVSVNGRRQAITNFSYVVAEAGAGVATAPATPHPAPRATDKYAPPLPPARIKPGDVRRTVALVVDDLGLSFQSMTQVRGALKKFVDEQMQEGDLVAIMRTSAGMGALQQFTSDKNILRRAIDGVKWYPGRGGISPFAAMEADNFAAMGGSRSAVGGGNPLESANDEMGDIFSAGTLGAMNFIVRGMEDLPGRKSVLMFSDGFRIYSRKDNTNAQRVLESLRRLVDLANRASVVIYTVDGRGLPVLNLTAADNTFGRSPAQIRDALNDRALQYLDTQDGLNYLAAETGGLFMHNTNDLSGAARKVLDDQRGYYLIGFRPEENVFEPVKGRRRFNDLDVKVKRSGLRVRSRSGFVGMTDAEAKPPRTTRLQQLVSALTSPFSSGDVRLRLTSLVGGDQAGGAVVTSLLHIDMSNVKFIEEADGWHKAVLDVVALTFGDEGTVIDEINRTETIRARGETLQRAQRDGLVYTMRVPVKPGAYQLRMAVRDATTEKLGSASQFIEVPDLKKDRLALSGIVMQTAGTSAGAGDAEGARNEPNPQGGPAVRRFHTGDVVEYFYNIYNAELDKTAGRPHLQTQMRLFRDREQVYAGSLTEFDLGKQTDMKMLHQGARIRLNTLDPGEYVLQVLVTDTLAPEKRRTVAQWIDFEVVK